MHSVIVLRPDPVFVERSLENQPANNCSARPVSPLARGVGAKIVLVPLANTLEAGLGKDTP